ncbi:hypothetical protein ORI99_00055 [Alishewanella sp. SMS9]|nr:hypothetical protein [Alishewanella sp. SMS9]
MATTVTDRQLSGGDWRFYLSAQTDQGAVNATPEFTPFRRTEGRLLKALSYTQSSEVSLDFNPSSQVQDGKELTAELSFEATKQSINYLIAAIYGSEVEVTQTGATVASTLTGFTGTPSGLAVGDYVFITGFANTLLNRTYRVTAKPTATSISTEPAPAAVVAAGDTVTVKTNRTTNANDATYFTGQNRVIDESKVGDVDYETAFDGLINAFSLEVGESGIIGGSQTIQFGREVSGTSAIAGQTDAAAGTDAPLSAVQNLANWYLAGVSALCQLKSATISISNENQRDQAAGCVDRYVRGQPTISIEGVSRSSIANSMVIRDYCYNSTRIGFGLEFDHGGGDKTVISIPQCVVTSWTSADGQNTISNDEFSMGAERSATLGYAIGVFRNWV